MKRRTRSEEQIPLDMVIPRAKAARAELVDHATTRRKRAGLGLYGKWPATGTIVEVLVDWNSPRASVRAVVLSVGPDREGELVGELETRPMPDVSDSLNASLPKRIKGVRLSALRKAEA